VRTLVHGVYFVSTQMYSCSVLLDLSLSLLLLLFLFFSFFFFNDTATTEIYTLSLHDALPIYPLRRRRTRRRHRPSRRSRRARARSEEHTSELQSHLNLVCRLLLEKKKKKQKT